MWYTISEIIKLLGVTRSEAYKIKNSLLIEAYGTARSFPHFLRGLPPEPRVPKQLLCNKYYLNIEECDFILQELRENPDDCESERGNVMWYTVTEVMLILGVKQSKAYAVIKELREEIKATRMPDSLQHYAEPPAGKIQKRYFCEKFMLDVSKCDRIIAENAQSGQKCTTEKN